jgi:hypothetical protein
VTGDITVTDPNALHGTDGVTWSHGTGVWKYTVNDARNAPSNIAVCLEASAARGYGVGILVACKTIVFSCMHEALVGAARKQSG